MNKFALHKALKFFITSQLAFFLSKVNLQLTGVVGSRVLRHNSLKLINLYRGTSLIRSRPTP